MYAQKWFPQDQSCGAIGQTLLGIKSLAELDGYSQFRAGVAYATFNGSGILEEELHRISCWRKSSKRWLISIDYGRTEPEALKFLAKIPNAEVRIPNGLKVVATSGFLPARPFHPKAYAVDDIAKGAKSVFGVFVGSGNLTGSGLLTGSECGALSCWSEPTGVQQKAMFSAYNGMSWFDTVWKDADPVSKIIVNYEKLWKKSKPPIVEEDEDVVALYVGGPSHVVEGDFAVALASAKAFWIEVKELYKNRGPNEAGNQVDTPRGTRVFFGFPPTAVARDTVLGQVMFRNEGFEPAECSVRFGNNQMDKINLLSQERTGRIVTTTRSCYLRGPARPPMGCRNSVSWSEMTPIWRNGKKNSLSEEERTMQSGRRYGVLF